MTNKEIIQKSFKLQDKQKRLYREILLIIFGITFIPTLLTLIEDYRVYIIIGILTLVLMPVNQGKIVMALKIIDEEELKLEDSIIGIKKYFSYISTYLINNIIEFLLIGLDCLFFGVIGFIMISIINFNIINKILVIGLSIGVVIILLIPMVLIIFKIMSMFFMVPYLLEENIKNFKAIGISRKKMKNHMRDYIRLIFSFTPYYILFIAYSVFVTFIGNEPIINTILINILGIFGFFPRLYICMALLYREINKIEMM